ncbi:hypothetical protein MN608_02457 [Microdochium nivale]|nr:hypothetical protein MN608_02457 [Microdochium nivale]
MRFNFEAGHLWDLGIDQKCLGRCHAARLDNENVSKHDTADASQAVSRSLHACPIFYDDGLIGHTRHVQVNGTKLQTLFLCLLRLRCIFKIVTSRSYTALFGSAQM